MYSDKNKSINFVLNYNLTQLDEYNGLSKFILKNMKADS